VTVALRPLTPADAPFVARVFASSRARMLALLPDGMRDAIAAQQLAAQTAGYAHRHPDADVDVVLVDGEPAGRLYVAREAGAIHVVDIALLPEFRGRGTGTALLRALLEEADAGGKRVRLQVEKTNPARRLYERLGFTVAADSGPDLELVR
jgi:ribosomal protein S18 acetylase RimI-like enzyme